jgi:hypothetical protein
MRTLSCLPTVKTIAREGARSLAQARRLATLSSSTKLLPPSPLLLITSTSASAFACASCTAALITGPKSDDLSAGCSIFDSNRGLPVKISLRLGSLVPATGRKSYMCIAVCIFLVMCNTQVLKARVSFLGKSGFISFVVPRCLRNSTDYKTISNLLMARGLAEVLEG